MAARKAEKKELRRVTKVSIENASIQPIKDNAAEPGGGPYTISLANSSNWVVVAVRRKDISEIIPVVKPVAKNCFLACQQCREAGNYEPILVIACNQPSFDLTLILRHPSGYAGESQPFNINPSCLYTGRILCFTAADP